MDARKKPYWPRPGQPTSRFLELQLKGVVLDPVWKGTHASYRFVHPRGHVTFGAWASIKKLY